MMNKTQKIIQGLDQFVPEEELFDIEDGDEVYDEVDPTTLLGEAGLWKRVVRGGKIKRKLVCGPGFKAVDGRCVRISGQEKIKRRMSTLKRLRTMRGKSKTQMKRKRAMSMKRRKGFGG